MGERMSNTLTQHGVEDERPGFTWVVQGFGVGANGLGSIKAIPHSHTIMMRAQCPLRMVPDRRNPGAVTYVISDEHYQMGWRLLKDVCKIKSYVDERGNVQTENEMNIYLRWDENNRRTGPGGPKTPLKTIEHLLPDYVRQLRRMRGVDSTSGTNANWMKMRPITDEERDQLIVKNEAKSSSKKKVKRMSEDAARGEAAS